MRSIQHIELDSQTREEQLPGCAARFPYIASCAHLDQYPDPFVPWHWHKAVELFCMEKGSLEYETPSGKLVFPEGSSGFVNSNVLHMTRVLSLGQPTIQKLHIFDPALLSGPTGGRLEETYFLPITADPTFEILAFDPRDSEQAEIIRMIRDAFSLHSEEFGYEIHLQQALLGIWLKLWQQQEQWGNDSRRKAGNVDRHRRLVRRDLYFRGIR